MNELEVFRFPATGEQVRSVILDGEIWFVARDVCAILEIGNVSAVLSRLDDDEYRQVAAALISNEARPQDRVNLVNEPGVYGLVLGSRKANARDFKRWLKHDVLPQIRMTGKYEPVPQLPQTYAQALRELASTVERAEEAERALAVAEPKAEAWEILASAEGDYAVREAAHILNRDPAIETGQNRLFRLLREWKLIDRNNRPYAAHSKHVRLRATHFFNEATGEEEVSTQVRITIAGLHYLHKRMGGVKQLQIIYPSEAA